MSDVTLVTVDPLDARTGILWPFVAQRAMAYTDGVTWEPGADQLTRQLLARSVAGDSNLILVALARSNGTVVGHALATVEGPPGNQWVYVLQVHADEPVGDALKDLVHLLDRWGRERGAKVMRMSPGRRERGWEKDFGFKKHRILMTRPLNGVGA